MTGFPVTLWSSYGSRSRCICYAGRRSRLALRIRVIATRRGHFSPPLRLYLGISLMSHLTGTNSSLDPPAASSASSPRGTLLRPLMRNLCSFAHTRTHCVATGKGKSTGPPKHSPMNHQLPKCLLNYSAGGGLMIAKKRLDPMEIWDPAKV